MACPPLQSASAFEHKKTVILLLAKNASINMTDNLGNTALDFLNNRNKAPRDYKEKTKP